MCDYSLLAIPNRLAVEGEPLVIHRFQTGAMGLAPAAEIAAPATEPHEPTRRQGWWSALKTYFMPSAAKVVCAVCIPPGARLLLQDIPERLQRECQVGAAESHVYADERHGVSLSRCRAVHEWRGGPAATARRRPAR